MPQQTQQPSSRNNTKPVPKEGESGEKFTSQTATPNQNQTAPLASEHSVQKEPEVGQSQPAPTTQTPPPSQQVVVKEKKRGGICNTTTCCAGSCFGCLFIIIVLVLLAIFAAPSLSKLLNRAIYPGVSIPEVEEVNTEEVRENLEQVLESEDSQDITISEEEFNTLLKERYEEEQGESLNLEIRTDFEKDSAKIYLKFSEWMPWAILEITNDENGQLTTSSLKLGPIDVSQYLGENLGKEISTPESATTTPSFESLDLTDLLGSVLFGDESDKITIQEVYFEKDAMRLKAISTQESTKETE